MSQKNPVKLFVTHNFEENFDYHRVFEFLESSSKFFYVNCSAPDNVPASGGPEALREELRKQVQAAEIVIVLDTVYEQNSTQVEFQMNAAGAAEIPVIVMEPYGSVKEPHEAIRKHAAEVVPWNERMMVDAILRQARHEDTHRWETIEFEL